MLDDRPRAAQPGGTGASSSHYGGGPPPIVIHALAPWIGSGAKPRIVAFFCDAVPLPITGTSPVMTVTQRCRPK